MPILFCYTFKCWIAVLVILLTAQNSRSSNTGVASSHSDATDVLKYVNPFIGTESRKDPKLLGDGRGGNTYPGAATPFGMVILSPETQRFESSSYERSYRHITAFSPIHMSGAGCVNSGEFPFLPLTTTDLPDPEGATAFFSKLMLPYSLNNETASPGYYRVQLDSGISVELTATTRTGYVRIRYPHKVAKKLVLHADRSAVGPIPGELQVKSQNEIFGRSDTGMFCNKGHRFPIFLYLQTQPKFKVHLDTGGTLVIDFSESESQTVEFKIGISYVSPATAKANLQTENPGWDFRAIQKQAESLWRQQLSKIQVEGGSHQRKVSFYTSLYHSVLHPNVVSDAHGAGGHYPGFGLRHRTRRTDLTRQHFGNISAWDTYRSHIQMIAWLVPDVTSQIMESLLADAQDCGSLPKWVHINSETAVMVGDPSSLLLANSAAFGARFSAKTALHYMKKSALDPKARCDLYLTRPGLASYLKKGYVPHGEKGTWGGAATTLEYALADFAISRFAAQNGETEFSQVVYRQSQNWKNVFNPKYDAFQPKDLEGRWIEPFNLKSRIGFVEGNGAQYRWMVPQQARDLLSLFSSKQKFIDSLDFHLRASNAGPDSVHFYIGNEPSFWSPWILAAVGEPTLAHRAIRKIQKEGFGVSSAGLPGNDDLGATSSWYFWSALGMYPMIPASSEMIITEPLFDRVSVRIPGRPAWEIQKVKNSEHPYPIWAHPQTGQLTELKDHILPAGWLQTGGILKVPSLKIR
jgi:predicted alpha-1,2-mannosidase